MGYFCPEGQALHENGTCVPQETGCQCKHGDTFYDLGDTNPSDCSKLVLYIVFILAYHIKTKLQVSTSCPKFFTGSYNWIGISDLLQVGPINKSDADLL